MTPVAEPGRPGVPHGCISAKKAKERVVMTRENKLALVIGFGLMLFVGILVSDHFAAQRYDPAAVAQADPVAPEESVQLEAVGLEQLAEAVPAAPAAPVDLVAGGTSALPDAVAVADAPVPGTDAVAMPVEVAVGDGTPVRFRKVQTGDSYWKIAKAEYGDGSLAQKLQDYNKAVAPDAAKLALGSELRIPPVEVLRPGAAAVAAVAGGAVAGAPAKPVQVAAADGVYRVQKGDTAYAIARKRGVKVAELLRHNGIKDPAQLKPGQSLRIPARF
jgi:LysM repeat protein